jgi:protein gp37
MSEEYWQRPLAWDRAAAARGVRERVFCGSMCDWLEQHPNPEINRQMDAYRGRLFDLIRRTPNLDWLLLSKRIEHAARYLPWYANGEQVADPWHNVWLGTTAEDQDHADRRIPYLLSLAARVHWLSLEPLLGPIDLHRIRIPEEPRVLHFSALQHQHDDCYGASERVVDWVIAGAESGHHARPCHTAWLRALRDQVRGAGRKYFLKQAVETWTNETEDQSIVPGISSRRKGRGYGGTMVELPELDGQQYAEVPEVSYAA